MITWRTVYKNGAHKFLRCAIGASKILARIIPEYVHMPNEIAILNCLELMLYTFEDC